MKRKGSDSAGRKSLFKAGQGRVDITPKVGVELCGYGPYFERKSTGVLDPLMARAIYWENGPTRMLYVGNDLIGVSVELTENFRRLCKEKLGLPATAVMMAGTHTHSGPATVELHAWGEKDPAYLERLPHLWLEAAQEAIRNAQPATMCVNSGPVETIGLDRHTPNGPVDKTLRAAAFKVDDKIIAILVNHATHGVVFGEKNTKISGDWPGELERRLEKEYPGAAAVFIQGSCGTINSKESVLDTEAGKTHIEAYGKHFAQEAIKLLKFAKTVEEDIELSCAAEDVKLPYIAASKPELIRWRDERISQRDNKTLGTWERNMARLYVGTYQKLIDDYDKGRYQDFCAAQVQVFHIGPLRLAAIPGELFMVLGQEIMDYRRDGLTMIAGYANDFLGYFGHAKAYGDQTYIYPIEMVPLIVGILPFQKQAGEILVDAAKRLITNH